MPRVIRAAILGFGNIAREHLHGYLQARHVELCGVADPVVSAESQCLLEQFKVPYFIDARTLLEKCRPDVVSICSPPAAHPALAELAFQHGAHVLCEKPLARTSAEARRMIEAARGAERMLAVAFCHRFIPAIRYMRDLLASRQLGRPLLYRNQFSGSFRGVDNSWFSDPEISGGGTLMDTTVHSVDLVRYLVGEIAQVRALTNTSRPTLHSEDNSIMLVKTQGGCLATLEASWTVDPGTLLIEVRCERGALRYDYEKLERYDLHTHQWIAETVSTGCDVRFDAEIRHFIECVSLNTKSTLLDAIEGLRALELIEKAYTDAACLA